MLRIWGDKGQNLNMWRAIKVLFVLAVLTSVAFIGFAYLGPIFMAEDFEPPSEEVVMPVTLGGDG